MDPILTDALKSMGWAVILIYAIKTLYLDAKLERQAMRAQLDALARVIGLLVLAFNHLADKMGTEGIDLSKIPPDPTDNSPKP